MGSFPGHLLPGAFFTCFGIWWSTQLLKRKRLCEVKGVPYYSTVTYPCGYGKCLEWPVEGIIKVVATVIGMAGETFAAFDYGQSSTIVSLGDIQHVTMYGFFFLSGLFDILQTKCTWLPPGLDYLALATAFSAEGILFHFHLHGRSELDSEIHILLVGTIFACVISILIEYKNPHSLNACAVRTYLVFLQGTWFIQVGFILYNPIPGYGNWKGDNHDHIQLATMIFVWHAIGVLFAMTFIVVVTSFIRQKYFPVTKYSEEYHVVGHHSYRLIVISDDEEEDVIYNMHEPEGNSAYSDTPQVLDGRNKQLSIESSEEDQTDV